MGTIKKYIFLIGQILKQKKCGYFVSVRFSGVGIDNTAVGLIIKKQNWAVPKFLCILIFSCCNQTFRNNWLKQLSELIEKEAIWGLPTISLKE